MANPYLKVRGTTADGEDAWLWHARNFMAGKTSRNRYEDPKTGQPTALAPRLEELCVDGSAEILYGKDKDSLSLGESVFVPASSGKFTLCADGATVLATTL